MILPNSKNLNSVEYRNQVVLSNILIILFYSKDKIQKLDKNEWQQFDISDKNLFRGVQHLCTFYIVDPLIYHLLSNIWKASYIVHRRGPGGSMRACHAAGPGSILGRDKFPGWGFFGFFPHL